MCTVTEQFTYDQLIKFVFGENQYTVLYVIQTQTIKTTMHNCEQNTTSLVSQTAIFSVDDLSKIKKRLFTANGYRNQYNHFYSSNQCRFSENSYLKA